MKTIIIIPARMASTRLPNKPLADISGQTMISRVYQQAIKTNLEVVVACDSLEIAHEINKIGGKYVLTDPDLPSGTDRIYQAYQNLGANHDVVVNLQGDLPNIDAKLILQCVNLLDNPNCDIGTLASIIADKEQINNPNVVKIALNSQKQALYFSRSAIPYKATDYLHHIGIYAYTKSALKKFVSLPPAKLEKQESLEQLRALENNLKIFVETVNSHPISVDTPADLILANKICSIKND
jgi:3-deoxy-manno-octulosonate cytidylyltransferase (CMP-KDO synthetase)